MQIPSDQARQEPAGPAPMQVDQTECVCIKDSVAGQVSVQDASIENSMVGAAVAGRDLTAANSFNSVAIAGRDLHLQQGNEWVLVVGNQAHVKNSRIGLLIARSELTLNESQVWMTTRQALAFGAAAGGAFALVLALKRFLHR